MRHDDIGRLLSRPKMWPMSRIMTVSPRYTLGQNVGVVNMLAQKTGKWFFGRRCVSINLRRIRLYRYWCHCVPYATPISRDEIRTSLNLSGDISPYGFYRVKPCFVWHLCPRTLIHGRGLQWILRAEWEVISYVGKWKLGFQPDGSLFPRTDALQEVVTSLYIFGNLMNPPTRESSVGARMTSKLWFGSIGIVWRLSESARLTVTLDYLAKRSGQSDRRWKAVWSPGKYIFGSEWQHQVFKPLRHKTNLEIKASEKIKLDTGSQRDYHQNKKATMIFIKLISRRAKTASNYTEKEITAYGRCNYTISSKMSVWWRGLRLISISDTSRSSVKADKIKQTFQCRLRLAYLSYKIDNNTESGGGYYYNIVMPTMSAVNPGQTVSSSKGLLPRGQSIFEAWTLPVR